MMPVLTRNNSRVLFVHIPKTGGSSIERFASDLGWTETFSLRGKPLKDIDYYRATPQHLHAQPLQEIFKLDSFDCIFTVVRNPFTRLKSEYYWQRRQGISSLNVSNWLTDTFNMFREDPSAYDNHIRPQVDFLFDIPDFKILRLEDQGISEAKELLKAFGRPNGKARLSIHLFRGLKKKEYKEKCSTPISEVEHEFRLNKPRIREFYYSDFNALGY